MRRTSWQSTAVLVDPTDPNWTSRLASAAPPPPAGRPGLCISFCSNLVGHQPTPDWTACIHWQNLVPTDILENLWQISYQDIKRLLATFPEKTKSWFECYLHVLADALLRHRALEYLTQSVKPDLIILPSNSELRHLFSRIHNAQGWVAKLLGGYSNVSRVKGWLNRRNKSNNQRLAFAAAATARQSSSVLLVVEDGGSSVHREPALAVAAQFVARGIHPRVLTSNQSIAHLFSSAGYTVCDVRPRSLWRLGWNFATCAVPILFTARRALRRTSPGVVIVGENFANWLRMFLPSLMARRLLLQEGLDQALTQAPVDAVLTLGETFPLAIVTLRWAQANRIANAGFTPVLIGTRPDNEDFPASHHLVYGVQALDCMRRHGINPKTIHVVGSPTYENVLGRNKTLDIQIIQAQLPAWKAPQRLIVVATEALPNPEKELIPVLQACAKLSGVRTVVKVHPTDSAQAITDIISEQGLLDQVDVLVRCDLAALLHAADLLVCVFSNIAVTAALLGTPTLVPLFSKRNRPVDFVANGMSVGCSDPAMLIEQLDSLSKIGISRSKALARMHEAKSEFAGPADGKSHTRIVEFMIHLSHSR